MGFYPIPTTRVSSALCVPTKGMHMKKKSTDSAKAVSCMNCANRDHCSSLDRVYEIADQGFFADQQAVIDEIALAMARRCGTFVTTAELSASQGPTAEPERLVV